ncbi:MAG: UDP-3-O-(3-hydroxymyristoyl)glucosamine N-acyltransferase [Pirellulaceae bacterium]
MPARERSCSDSRRSVTISLAFANSGGVNINGAAIAGPGPVERIPHIISMALSDVADLGGGELTGDGGVNITGASILRDAREGDITLADGPNLAKSLTDCNASAVMVPHGVEPEGVSYITVGNVHASFARIVAHFRPGCGMCATGVSPAAHVSDTAKIGVGVSIHPGASVGDEVEIGDGCTIHSGVHILARTLLGSDVTIFPNAVLHENTVVGDRVVIHAGAVIGAYGFGYETIDGRHVRSAQLGYVELGDDVEIGANTTIDRGTYGPTRIGEGTKIDNLVMIAHNCSLGKHNILCSQVGIAGSCTTGDYVVMAGQVGLRDHVHIGTRAVLGAKAGVMSDIPEGAVFLGIPATPEREQAVKQAAWSKLPEMRKQFKALQKQVAQLSARIEQEPAEDGREAAFGP